MMAGAASILASLEPDSLPDVIRAIQQRFQQGGSLFAMLLTVAGLIMLLLTVYLLGRRLPSADTGVTPKC